MFYAIKTARDTDGCEIGFYVSVHEHEEVAAHWTGRIFSTVEEADVDVHQNIGYRIRWQEPGEDAAPDVVAIAADSTDSALEETP